MLNNIFVLILFFLCFRLWLRKSKKSDLKFETYATNPPRSRILRSGLGNLGPKMANLILTDLFGPFKRF